MSVKDFFDKKVQKDREKLQKEMDKKKEEKEQLQIKIKAIIPLMNEFYSIFLELQKQIKEHDYNSSLLAPPSTDPATGISYIHKIVLGDIRKSFPSASYKNVSSDEIFKNNYISCIVDSDYESITFSLSVNAQIPKTYVHKITEDLASLPDKYTEELLTMILGD